MDKGDELDQIRKYGIALTPRIVNEVDAKARLETMSRSSIVRQAIKHYLRESPKQQEGRSE